MFITNLHKCFCTNPNYGSQMANISTRPMVTHFTNA